MWGTGPEPPKLTTREQRLVARVAELKEMLNEVMPWVASPEMQDRIIKILNR